MAVDLHARDTSFPSQFLPYEDNHLLSHKSNNDKEDDFIAELTHRMAHFMLQDDDALDFSGIGSQTHPNFEQQSWDLRGSPQSTLWSLVGSPEGSSSSQEPSPPVTPVKSQDPCWKMFEKLKLEKTGDSKYHHDQIQSSNIGLCSYQSLIQEQIRAIELSRLKQEHVVSPKQKRVTYGKVHQDQISEQSEPKQKIQQFQKKGKVGGNGRRNRPPPRHVPQTQQHAGAGMRAVFLGGSGSRSGTGVFLPRGGTGSQSESTNKQGKGCSTVLIPARVVQALQLHFEKTAAMSGPKVVGFPPLHDVLVSNMDGMYSLQKGQSMKASPDVQNEMILPQEWTY
ncbi:hypothetical protein SESBI_20466 [Sesbania bispinosa]|nr:hypothetical protein SESBI_20466 [Sesbania bispinosa]